MLGDRSEHRRFCRKINDARVAICDTEGKIQSRLQEDTENPWRWPSFHRYMEARRSEIDALIAVDTYEAYKRAWHQAKDMLLFSKEDVLGIHYYIPFLLIRLRKEQRLFDYLNWYACRPGESIRELDLPEYTKKDIFDWFDVDNNTETRGSLYFFTLLILLKTKFLIDIYDLERPPEERGDIAKPVSRRLRNASARDLQRFKEHLSFQICLLHDLRNFKNPYFWQAFTQPNRFLNVEINPNWQQGSFEEAQFVLQKTHRAWNAIPEARAAVQDLQRRRWQ